MCAHPKRANGCSSVSEHDGDDSRKKMYSDLTRPRHRVCTEADGPSLACSHKQSISSILHLNALSPGAELSLRKTVKFIRKVKFTGEKTPRELSSALLGASFLVIFIEMTSAAKV